MSMKRLVRPRAHTALDNRTVWAADVATPSAGGMRTSVIVPGDSYSKPKNLIRLHCNVVKAAKTSTSNTPPINCQKFVTRYREPHFMKSCLEGYVRAAAPR